MSIQHRKIPVLPHRPRVRPVHNNMFRSYPVGRQSFSRACQGEVLTLTISTDNPYPENIKANLLTSLNSRDGKTLERIPFTIVNPLLLECHIKILHPGLQSFRAEFSLDNGNSWLRDTVPDAWILIDPPHVDGLIMYTIIPNVSGTVADWQRDLKRIRDMGFNTVHLLPLTTMDTSESPYAAKDLFNIDPGYIKNESSKDGLSQLEEFIEEARLLNIRLCFDLVLNHVGVHSKIAKQVPDWIVPDPNQADGFQRARYWSGNSWCNWDDLVMINYEHPSDSIRAEIWNYMTEYMLFWSKYADYTGGFVRFDNLHSSDPDFVQMLTEKLHSEYPELGILAEYFTDETTLLHTGPKWGLNLNLATPWDYKFVPKLREYLKYIHRVSKHIRYFMPLTSHDSGSPAQEFGSVESTVPRYVAAALLGTGATGIIQGVEFGEQERINFIGKQPRMVYPSEPKFAPFISKINSILKDYPIFRRGEVCHFVDDDHQAIIAAFRYDTELNDLGFLVLCNFDIWSEQKIRIDLTPFLASGETISCCDLISEENIIFTNQQSELTLSPCAAMVLKCTKNNN